MKITKIVLHWDNGGTTEHSDPTGIDLGGLLGSAEDISNAPPASLGGLIQGVLTGAIGLLIRKFGLSI